MKICPTCQQTYNDPALNYCLIDGAILVPTSASQTAAPPAINPITNRKTDEYTNAAPAVSQPTVIKPIPPPKKSGNLIWVSVILGALVLLCGGGGLAGLLVYLSAKKSDSANYNSPIVTTNKKIESNVNLNIPNISVKPINSTNTNTVTTINTNASDPSNTNANNAPSANVTMAKYMQLQPDISYQEAVKILGGEGAETSSSGSGRLKVETYKWNNSDFEGVSLTFVNNQLKSRRQTELNKGLSPTVTLEKFTRLKNGMSYQDAVAILGEGDETSNDILVGSKIASYQWRVDKYSYLILYFSNGKLNSKSQYGLK